MYFQLTEVVGAPRQTNCSTRPKAVQNLRKNAKQSDRQVRYLTKQHKDSTLVSYDEPPSRLEKIKNAKAICTETVSEKTREEVLFCGEIANCPQPLLEQVQEEVKLVEKKARVKEKKDEFLDDSFEDTINQLEYQEEVDYLDEEDQEQDQTLNDSLEVMFTQHEEEFNSQFEAVKRKRMAEIHDEEKFRFQWAKAQKLQNEFIGRKTEKSSSCQNKEYCCHLCQKFFKSPKFLARHLMTKHEKNPQKKKTQPKKAASVKSTSTNSDPATLEEVAIELEKSSERIKVLADMLQKEKNREKCLLQRSKILQEKKGTR